MEVSQKQINAVVQGLDAVEILIGIVKDEILQYIDTEQYNSAKSAIADVEELKGVVEILNEYV